MTMPEIKPLTGEENSQLKMLRSGGRIWLPEKIAMYHALMAMAEQNTKNWQSLFNLSLFMMREMEWDAAALDKIIAINVRATFEVNK